MNGSWHTQLTSPHFLSRLLTSFHFFSLLHSSHFSILASSPLSLLFTPSHSFSLLPTSFHFYTLPHSSAVCCSVLHVPPVKRGHFYTLPHSSHFSILTLSPLSFLFAPSHSFSLLLTLLYHSFSLLLTSFHFFSLLIASPHFSHLPTSQNPHLHKGVNAV